MSDTLIQLSDSSNWSYRGQVSKTARSETINRRVKYFPIPMFDLGFTLNARFLAVEVLVREAKVTWRSGGFLNQSQPIAFATKASPKGQAVSNSAFLLINRTNLVTFPRLSGKSYRLVYSPPFWFRDVRLRVWQYRGLESNFTEDTVKRIEDKVNQLL